MKFGLKSLGAFLFGARRYAPAQAGAVAASYAVANAPAFAGARTVWLRGAGIQSPWLWIAALAAAPAFAQNYPLPQVPLNDPPPFDCAKATGRVEKIISGDRSLYDAEAALGAMYRRLLSHSPPGARPAIQRRQRDWVKRRNACADKDCVNTAYTEGFAMLRGPLDARDAVLRRGVSRVGQCERATIDSLFPSPETVKWMGPSFRGTTQVTFANGVRQYDERAVPVVHHSRIGDPVRVCLIHVAKCGGRLIPARQYSVFNLRTKEAWWLHDDRYRCRRPD